MSICLSLVLLVGHPWGFLTTVQADHHPQHAPTISAQAAALIDVQSGRVVYSKAADQPMLIASLTKIMTAIVALENGNSSDLVKAGRNAVGKEGSSIYLQLGEEMVLEHLLYGLMLRSGNDAATAIAEHVGGSLEGFVLLMNQKAEELGLQHTQFQNPHGLDAEGHYSTARDLAVLTAYALQNEQFREIVKTDVKSVPNPHEAWNYRWRNKNKMLHLYEGADGVKTGYTKRAGRCLVSSATRNGQQFVVVTINASNDWQDHARLLDYGFEHFPEQTIVHKGAHLAGTTLLPEHAFRYPLTKQEIAQVKLHLDPVPLNDPDYRLGIQAYLQVKMADEQIGTVRMVEPNSPRLQMERAAFHSTSASQRQLSYLDRFQQSLTKLVRALFLNP